MITALLDRQTVDQAGQVVYSEAGNLLVTLEGGLGANAAGAATVRAYTNWDNPRYCLLVLSL